MDIVILEYQISNVDTSILHTDTSDGNIARIDTLGINLPSKNTSGKSIFKLKNPNISIFSTFSTGWK